MKRRSPGESRVAPKERATSTPLRATIRAILFAFLLFAAWSATFLFYTSPERVRVTVGEPSPRDIKAQRSVTYISGVKTQEARQNAASKVADVFTGPDMEIATQQLQAMQDITDYIDAIRHDEFASSQQKRELIREIPGFDLSPEVLSGMLVLDEDAWQGVVVETLRVLDLALREEIRADQLAEAKRRVPRLISRTLTGQQQAVVIALTQSFITPNSFFDPQETEANREAARSAVDPVPWNIRTGESVLREGEIITELAFEKLQVLGLLKTDLQWQDSVAVVLFCLVMVVVFGAYVARSQPLLLARPRRQLLLVLTLIVAGLAARIIIPGHVLMPYLFPTAAVTMLVTILLDVQLAMVVSGILAIVVGFNAGGSIELITYALVGGMIGALITWRMEHLGAFVRAAVYVALANVTLILAFRLRSQLYDAEGLIQLLAMGFVNGILSSSLTFVAFSLIGRLFGITTSLQLLELARPTHPLFRQLLIKAPGTYHHSIVISNMAERAAQAIGADALLARVGCYYHDIGKSARPYFFAENQSDGENPHDTLDPRTSAEIIIAHTTDGLSLARAHGLPDRIRDFISEHHGTTLARYFYQRANQNNGGNPVPEAVFRYPGPKPQSKETAIVMLADSIEATVRADRPSTQEEMAHVIRKIINDRLMSGQLDECNLTLSDLDKVRKAFMEVLQGVFHPRIQYPETVQSQASETASPS